MPKLATFYLDLGFHKGLPALCTWCDYLHVDSFLRASGYLRVYLVGIRFLYTLSYVPGISYAPDNCAP